MSKNLKIIKIGIVGCGDVSHLYIKNLIQRKNIEISFCYDNNPENSKFFSKHYKIDRIVKFSQVLDSSVDIVLLLTPPNTRAKLIPALLNARLSVYTEKPLAINYAEAKKLAKIAQKNNVFLNSAPDLHLCKWLNSVKSVLDSKILGEIMSIHCFILSDGPEHWHPRPEQFYQKGGGPIFDRSIYYITAMVELFGEIVSVFAFSKKLHDFRKNCAKNEELFPVLSDTHYHVLLQFSKGYSASLIASFDIKTTENDHFFVIYGSKNTLKIPNPMEYSGKSYIWNERSKRWDSIEMPDSKGVDVLDEVRGFGVIEMAENLKNKKYMNSNLDRSLNVQRIMDGIIKSALKDKIIKL